MKKDICAYTYEQLQAEIQAMGERGFRAKQIYEWLHVRLAEDFSEMTNLSRELQYRLIEQYEILPVVML